MSFALMASHQQGRPFCPVSFVSSRARGKARRYLQVSGKNRSGQTGQKNPPTRSLRGIHFPVMIGFILGNTENFYDVNREESNGSHPATAERAQRRNLPLLFHFSFSVYINNVYDASKKAVAHGPAAVIRRAHETREYHTERQRP